MLNRVELIGNLSADATVRDVGDGRKATNVSLATHRGWTDKEGNRREDTQWHSVIFWGRQADLVLSPRGVLAADESPSVQHELPASDDAA